MEIEKIEEAMIELSEFLIENLTKIGIKVLTPFISNKRNSIVCFKVDRPNVITKLLRERNIYVAARKGGIRVSIGLNNNSDDIEEFCKQLQDIIKKN